MLFYKTKKVLGGLQRSDQFYFLHCGSHFLDLRSMTLTDAETDESFDLSGALPMMDYTPNYGVYDAAGKSSSDTGKLLLYWPSKSIGSPIYLVSSKFVFKVNLPESGDPVFQNHFGFLFPCERHATHWYGFADQMIYKIGEDSLEIYDAQTFMRLDDLPGFQQPRVEKVWERPKS